MTIGRRVARWFQRTGATDEEIHALSHADALMPAAADRWVRCITISAPVSVVYRWLCQLTLAPYSFDFIDFRGRKSPERLIPGAENLRIGQNFLIFTLTSFETNRYIAGVSRPEFHTRYGRISVSYEIRELTPTKTRLQANACIEDGHSPLRRALLAAGDKIMAGRQLLRLKKLAEKTNAEPDVNR